MKDKYLQVIKESIFTRFVNFVKRIFEKKVQQEKPTFEETLENKGAKSNFFGELKVNKEENKELLDLQSKYEKNEIDLCVMSNKEIHELNLLYKRQVSDLKRELNDKKRQLSIMKNKIKSYSTSM